MNYLDFILENGEAWLQYAVKLNVLGESKDSLKELREQALSDPKIKTCLLYTSWWRSCMRYFWIRRNSRASRCLLSWNCPITDFRG